MYLSGVRHVFHLRAQASPSPLSARPCSLSGLDLVALLPCQGRPCDQSKGTGHFHSQDASVEEAPSAMSGIRLESWSRCQQGLKNTVNSTYSCGNFGPSGS